MPTSTITGDLDVTGDLSMGTITLPGGVVADAQIANGAEVRRAALALDALKPYGVPLTYFRVWDDISDPLPNAAANDDLGLINGTFATDAPMIQAGDIGGAASTRRARFLIPIPAEYAAAETLQLQASAGMITTICDDTCTLDFEAYELDLDGGLVGGPTDLIATAAQSMNSLTFAELVYTITATNLVAGDVLDVRASIAYSDVGDAGVMIPAIADVRLLADVRG
jgi:hypothetical protein